MGSEPGVNKPEFWEDLYRAERSGWDLGRAAPPLARWLAGPSAPTPPRHVAVLGSGFGHDALLFARAGHDVTGFDFATSAIEGARARAESAGVPVRFEQADIFTLPERVPRAFDLVVEHTFFCAIDPRRRPEYVEVVRGILAPRGELIALFLPDIPQDGPPFPTSREELERLFTPSFEILSLETPLDSVESRAGRELLGHFRLRG